MTEAANIETSGTRREFALFKTVYLRKWMKYEKVKGHLTTTGYMFDQVLQSLLGKFNNSKSKDKKVLFNVDSSVAQYLRGNMMVCGKSWKLCDEVMMPMNTNDH